MEQQFDLYFNQILRGALRYPETFRITFDVSEDKRQIVLHPDQSSRLLELIKSNKDLKQQLLQKVANFLGTTYSIGEVDFFTNGTDIIIRFDVNLEDLPIRDVSLLSNIAKDLPVMEIERLCVLNKNFENACRNPDFWQTLVRESFNGQYRDVVGNYNWYKVYKGLKFYHDSRDEIFPLIRSNLRYLDDFWGRFADSYPESIQVLIYGNTKFSDKELESVLGILIYYNKLNEFQYILNNYKLTSDILNIVVTDAVGKPKFLKLLFDYQGTDSQGEIVKLDKKEVQEIYDYYMDHDQPELSIEEFKVWYEYLHGSWKDDILLAELAFMNTITEELATFIVSKLSDTLSTLELQKWFIENIQNDNFIQVEAMWKKYGKYLHQYIQEFKDTTKDVLESDVSPEEYDKYISIFK